MRPKKKGTFFSQWKDGTKHKYPKTPRKTQLGPQRVFHASPIRILPPRVLRNLLSVMCGCPLCTDGSEGPPFLASQCNPVDKRDTFWMCVTSLRPFCAWIHVPHQGGVRSKRVKTLVEAAALFVKAERERKGDPRLTYDIPHMVESTRVVFQKKNILFRDLPLDSIRQNAVVTAIVSHSDYRCVNLFPTLPMPQKRKTPSTQQPLRHTRHTPSASASSASAASSVSASSSSFAVSSALASSSSSSSSSSALASSTLASSALASSSSSAASTSFPCFSSLHRSSSVGGADDGSLSTLPYTAKAIGGDVENVSSILHECPNRWDESVPRDLIRWGAKPPLLKVERLGTSGTYPDVECYFGQPDGTVSSPLWLPLVVLRVNYPSFVSHFKNPTSYRAIGGGVA